MDLMTVLKTIMDFLLSHMDYVFYAFVGLIFILLLFLPLWKTSVSLKNYEVLVSRLNQIGVSAPALIVSATSNETFKAFGRYKMRKVNYSAEVQPQNGQPGFRANFIGWYRDFNFKMILFNSVVGATGRKAWVLYDPHDPKQVIFDHYDDDHAYTLYKRDLNRRAGEFLKVATDLDKLVTSGLEGTAVILKVEDLNLLFSADNSYAMIFDLEVTPRSGAPFRAKTYALISRTALHKYITGKKVFVKYDAANPQRVVLTRSMEN